MRMTSIGWSAAVVVIGGFGARAAAQEQVWIQQLGSSGGDHAYGLAPDGAGGAYLAGGTSGDLGGPNAGQDDPWLARYDSAGSRAWIRQFGSSDWDHLNALSPDGAGGVFVAGYTYGDLGGANAGETDAWLVRYDGAGNQAWTRQFGTSSFDAALALSPDGAGGAFVAGSTGGDLGGPNAGPSDVWLARYDNAGDRMWIRQFGSSDGEDAFALAPDGAGGAYVAGYTAGDLGGPNAGWEDVWVSRYDSAGEHRWTRQFGSSDSDFAAALSPDGAGGAFIAGWTHDDLGGPNAGGQDAWLARYDSAGDRMWIRQFGSSDGDRAVALSPDGAGGALMAGWTSGDLGGPSAGSNDAWLARYDSAGGQTWVRQFGSGDDDAARTLAPDGAGGAYLAGGTVGDLGGPNAGQDDAWLARWTGDAPCPADVDGDGELSVADFTAFRTMYLNGDPAADFNDNGSLDVGDFTSFRSAYLAGCH